MKNDIIELLYEIKDDYELITSEDIENFIECATDYDEQYIDQLIGKCSMWTLKKNNNDKYPQRIKRDEIKMCNRVLYRLNKNKKS